MYVVSNILSITCSNDLFPMVLNCVTKVHFLGGHEFKTIDSKKLNIETSREDTSVCIPDILTKITDAILMFSV